MSSRSLRVVLAAAALGGIALGAVGELPSVAATPATAALPSAKTAVISGSIVAVNAKAHRFVVLSGGNRLTVITTSQTRLRLDGHSAGLARLERGLAVTVRVTLRARYRVASTVTARHPAAPVTSTAVSSALSSALNAALVQERAALQTYTNVTARFGPIRPFSNIIPSEQRQISTLTALMGAHGVAVSSESVTGASAPATRTAACQLGVTVETRTVELYRSGLALAKAYPDIAQALGNLADASESNHLPAFLRCS